MKSWPKYIKEIMNTDLWCFSVLDSYTKKKYSKSKDSRLILIDSIILKYELSKSVYDPVRFHKNFLCLCVYLLGNEYDEIFKKSIKLLRAFGNRFDQEKLKLIAEQYATYGQAEAFLKEAKKSFRKITKKRRKNSMAGVSLFYSYSTKNEKMKELLEEHLALLKREKLLSDWNFRKITAGKKFDDEIDKNLRRSKIILLLVSASFINSDYCYTKELKVAMDMDKKGTVRVIPVILRPCDWKSAPFAKLQALPKDGKPVASWKNRDEAFEDIAIGIRKVINELKA